MRKIINRLAYFFNDYDNYVGITIITLIGEFIIGTIYALIDFFKTGSMNRFNTNMFILILVALITSAAIMIFRRIFDVSILSDFKKLTIKTKHKALDYKEKASYKGDEEEKYYVINIDGENEKVVKADTILINKQDKFADDEHKVGSKKVEFVEVEFDKALPEYKKKVFKEHMGFERYKEIKHQLNITYYVSEQASKNEKAFYEPYEPTQTKESEDSFDPLAALVLFSMLISVILVVSITLSVIASL